MIVNIGFKLQEEKKSHYLIIHEGFETLDHFMLVPFINLLLPIDTTE